MALRTNLKTRVYFDFTTYVVEARPPYMDILHALIGGNAKTKSAGIISRVTGITPPLLMVLQHLAFRCSGFEGAWPVAKLQFAELQVVQLQWLPEALCNGLLVPTVWHVAAACLILKLSSFLC